MGAGNGAPAGDEGGPAARSRIEAVNLLTAATSWRSPLQRFGFWLLRRTDWQAERFGRRQSLLLNLKDLNHLHYGSWVDIGTFPAVRCEEDYPTESGRRYWNVFNGNFNHGWEPYMESFLDNTAGGVHLAWGDTIGYSGYPRHGSLKDTLRWQHERRIDNLHYYVAYPGATTNDVRAAVRLRRELLSFWASCVAADDTADAADASDAIGAADLERLHRRLQHCVTGLPSDPMEAGVTLGPTGACGTDGFTVLFPVRPNQVPDVVKTIEGWKREGPSPFASVPGTHFGRIVLIPKGTTADQGDDVPLRNTWLQLSVVIDVCATGPAAAPTIAATDLERYAADLLANDAVREVLGCCYGWPGQDGDDTKQTEPQSPDDGDGTKQTEAQAPDDGDDTKQTEPQALRDWFASGVCPRYLVYRDYPDVTLREIHEGFRLAKLFGPSLSDDAKRSALLALCEELLTSPHKESQSAEGGEDEVLATLHGDQWPW